MNPIKLTNPFIWVGNGVSGQKTSCLVTQSWGELVPVCVCVCVCTGESMQTAIHFSYAKLVKLSQIHASLVCLNDIKSRSTCRASILSRRTEAKNKYHAVSRIFPSLISSVCFPPPFPPSGRVHSFQTGHLCGATTPVRFEKAVSSVKMAPAVFLHPLLGKILLFPFRRRRAFLLSSSGSGVVRWRQASRAPLIAIGLETTCRRAAVMRKQRI